MITTLMTWFIAAAASFAVAILICRTILRSSSAAVRHLILTTAFAVALAAPIATLLLPRVAPVPPLRSTFVMVIGPEAAASQPASPADSKVDWTTAIAWMWSLGVALALARLYTAVRYRSQYSEPAPERVASTGAAIARELGIARRVRFLQSDAAVVAETHGWRRPVVVLPSETADWSAERLEVVLRHELTHIVRNDWLATALAEVGAAVHWYNPLAWAALKELRREREIACDDDVLAQGVDGCDYADHLLGIAAGLRGRPCAASVAMAQASHLETRIQSILDPGLTRGGITMLTRIGAASLAAGFLVLVAATQAPAQSGAAALTGTVIDASSARVPHASVIVRNTENRKMEITRTNETGEFAFNALPPGTYTVEVACKGFQLWKQENVTMPAGSAQSLTVMLNLGKISETLEVQGTRSSPAPAPAAAGEPKRLRVGGGVQFAKMVKQVRPYYPVHLKEAGIEGTVLFEAVIGRDGSIQNLQLLNSQVHQDLVQVATEAVQQWRYEPTYLNGDPVEIITHITINFTLAK